MLKRKRLRTRGKAQLSEHFKEFKEGDRVAIIRDRSYQFPLPERMNGITGKIIGKRGEAYLISMKDGKKQKTVILKPIHLKKLKNNEIKEKGAEIN